MADQAADKRRKGTIAGLCLIAFGIVGAIIGYIQDPGSFDIVRMIEAGNFAVLHLALWTVAGLRVIAWYQFLPGDRSRDDDPPARFRDWTGRKPRMASCRRGRILDRFTTCIARFDVR